jgi:hypothetical protein
VLIGFKSDQDWFDYQLENDPRFLRRLEQARKSLRDGRAVNTGAVWTFDFPNRLPSGDKVACEREGVL